MTDLRETCLRLLLRESPLTAEEIRQALEQGPTFNVHSFMDNLAFVLAINREAVRIRAFKRGRKRVWALEKKKKTAKDC